jgi:hypothetical protein
MKTKADLTSLIIGAVVIVVILGVIAVPFAHVLTETINELQNSGEFSDTTNQTMEKVKTKTVPLLDFFIFFSFAAIVIGLIISSIYLDLHPAITVAFIIGLIVAVFLASQFVNVYSEVGAVSEISPTADKFTFSNALIGQFFPLIILVVGLIVVVILYGKSRRVGDV